MLPPYAKPAPRREPALQSRTTPIGLERSLFPLSSAAGGGRGPSPRNLSTSFWESASSIINRAFNSRSEIPANRGGSRARGRVGTARPDNGRAWAAGSLGAGAERGPRRGGASAEEQGGGGLLPRSLGEALKMAGGNPASGSRRRRRVRPSARLGRPRSRPQRPRPDVSAARHWPSGAGASRTEGGRCRHAKGHVSRAAAARARPPEASDGARPRPRAPCSRLSSLPFPGRPVLSAEQ